MRRFECRGNCSRGCSSDSKRNARVPATAVGSCVDGKRWQQRFALRDGVIVAEKHIHGINEVAELLVVEFQELFPFVRSPT